jgi:hypothetical protein
LWSSVRPMRTALNYTLKPWSMAAGVAMRLPVYHIMEPEVKGQIDPKTYEEHLGLMEIALEVDKITAGLNRVRKAQNG